MQSGAGQGFQGGRIWTSPGAVEPLLLTPLSSSVPSGQLHRGDDLYWQFLYLHRGDTNTDPNAQAATVSFFFTGPNGSFGSGSTTIPANGQIAKFLNDRSVRERLGAAGNADDILAIFENTAPAKA